MTETTNVARNQLYQTFTKVAHRQYELIVPDLRTAMAADPDFIARACVDFSTGGTEIRDLADCAVITLLTAPCDFPEYREAGRCCLLGQGIYPNIVSTASVPGIPVFSPRIFRISDFISRDKGHKAPRFMSNVIEDYLRFLEANPTMFDSIVMRNRRAVKNLYVHYHIPMSERAKAILHDNQPPEDSKLAALKQIASTNDINEKVRLIVEHRIPYVTATSLLPKLTPVVGIALIEVMSPQEALNSRHWVEQSGLLGIPEVRSVYEAKVAKASASAATAAHRVSAQGADEGVQKAVEAAREVAVAKQQHYDESIVLYMDISGSMEHAIGIAAELASRIAPLCSGDFSWVAFNDMSREVVLHDRTLRGAEQAVKGLRAGGGTNLEQAFSFSLRQGRTPQKIVIVSDGAPHQGSFSVAVQRYAERVGFIPKVVFLRVPGESDTLTPEMSRAGLDLDRFETDGSDYNVFDQVAQALGGPLGQSLVERILSIQLPYRQ